MLTRAVDRQKALRHPAILPRSCSRCLPNEPAPSTVFRYKPSTRRYPHLKPSKDHGPPRLADRSLYTAVRGHAAGRGAVDHRQSGRAQLRQGHDAVPAGRARNSFYVVLDGWVKLFRVTPDGDEAVVGVFRRGETFAEAAIFLGGRYPVSAEVVTPSRLLARRRRGPAPAHPRAAGSGALHAGLVVLSPEGSRRADRADQGAVGAAAHRRFPGQAVSRARRSCTIELPYEKALIASRLGMKPESLSRALAKLRPLGVSVDREHVSIVDVEAPRQLRGIERPRRGRILTGIAQFLIAVKPAGSSRL